jgi:hypothetical protein
LFGGRQVSGNLKLLESKTPSGTPSMTAGDFWTSLVQQNATPAAQPVGGFTLLGLVPKSRSACDHVRRSNSVVPIRTSFKRVSDGKGWAALHCRLLHPTIRSAPALPLLRAPWPLFG